MRRCELCISTSMTSRGREVVCCERKLRRRRRVGPRPSLEPCSVLRPRAPPGALRPGTKRELPVVAGLRCLLSGVPLTPGLPERWGGGRCAVLGRKGGWRPWVPTGGVACSAAGQSAVQAGISRDLSAICWLESRLCQERPSQRGLWTRAPSPLACRTRAACGAAPLDAGRGAAPRLLGLRRRSWPPVPAARFTEAQTPGGGTVDCSPRCPRPEPHCRARRL